jgi:hypothetical protein
MSSYLINLNGVNTVVDMNIIPLGFYEILIGMDWLDQYHVVLDCHNNNLHVLMKKKNKAL